MRHLRLEVGTDREKGDEKDDEEGEEEEEDSVYLMCGATEIEGCVVESPVNTAFYVIRYVQERKKICMPSSGKKPFQAGFTRRNFWSFSRTKKKYDVIVLCESLMTCSVTCFQAEFVICSQLSRSRRVVY